MDVLPNSAFTARRAYLLAAIFCVAGLLTLSLDLKISQFFFPFDLWAPRRIPGEIRRLLTYSEVFAHGLGVMLIGLTVFVLDRTRRWSAIRVLAGALGAGVVANCVKVLVPRIRPQDFNLQGSVWDSFQGFAPLVSSDNWWEMLMHHTFQSFPSGHAAGAAGLAVGLTWRYPHGGWLFASFAVLASIQRVDGGAHFISDTLAGGALGCLMAGFCLDRRVFGRGFDRLEARCSASGKLPDAVAGEPPPITIRISA